MSDTTTAPNDASTRVLTAHHLKELQRNLNVLKSVTDGMTQEQSLIPFMEGASHLNWMLSHLIASRDSMLRLLGGTTVWDEETAQGYRRGSRPASAADAPALEALLVDLERSQAALEEAMARVGADRLAEESGRSTVGARLEFLVWHEAYHTGQSIHFRRLAGLDSPIG